MAWMSSEFDSPWVHHNEPDPVGSGSLFKWDKYKLTLKKFWFRAFADDG